MENEINKNSANDGSGNKLRTYAKYKKEFAYESYLNFSKDFGKRKSITKLRISAHRLEIECGRYKKVEESKRLCRNCNLNVIENEQHVLLTCPKYATCRNSTFSKLYDIFPDLVSKNDSSMFCFLLACNDSEIFHLLSAMLQNIIALRGEV